MSGGPAPAVLLLGAGESRLEAWLRGSAEAWGRQVAPEASFAAAPGEGLVGAVQRVLSAHGPPLLVGWPVLARLRPAHAAAALDDLAAGCDLVLGPTTDGGLYLLGLARALPPEVLGQFEAWPLVDDAVGTGARVALSHGLEIGLLRAERPLRTPADWRAARVDPTTPGDVLELLDELEAA